MPSNSHWYPRYVGDYARKTAHLTMLEHGAYTLLLDHYYSTGNPLPANAGVLQRVCRAFADAERVAVQSVLDQFFVLSGDGYHNKKADEELIKRCGISEIRRKAAAARYAKDNAKAYANAHAIASTSTSTSTEQEIKKSISAKRPIDKNGYSLDFKTFWAAFPRKIAKAHAWKAYQKAIGQGIDPDTILSAARRYTAEREGQDPQFTKHPATWLNGECWSDGKSDEPEKPPAGVDPVEWAARQRGYGDLVREN